MNYAIQADCTFPTTSEPQEVGDALFMDHEYCWQQENL